MTAKGDTMQFNFARTVFEINRCRPQQIAFIDDRESLSYGDLEMRSRAFCASLDALGMRSGDRLMLTMSDNIDWPVVLFACLLGNYVCVIANPRTIKPKLEYMINLADPRVIVTSRESHDTVADILCQPRQSNITVIPHDNIRSMSCKCVDHDPAPTWHDDMAYWLVTSGSSGEPKAVVLHHGAMFEQAKALQHAYHIQAGDIVLCSSKLSWSYGLCMNLYLTTATGATSILRQKLATVPDICAAFNKHKPKLFASTPTVYALLMASQQDLSMIDAQYCICCGEPMPKPLALQWKQNTGLDLRNAYGITETGGVILPGSPDIDSMGTPLPGIDLEVRLPDGSKAGIDEFGELFVRATSMAMGYYRDLARSRAAFKGEWFATGDTFVQKPCGDYVFMGRNNDMFRVNAQWVSPVEIESVLCSHPQVREAAVVGRPDGPNGINRIIAYLVLRTDVVVGENFQLEIKRLVQKTLELCKAPNVIKVVDQLPRNENGKMQRKLLT